MSLNMGKWKSSENFFEYVHCQNPQPSVLSLEMFYYFNKKVFNDDHIC
jgi:hypothetical protein